MNAFAARRGLRGGLSGPAADRLRRATFAAAFIIGELVLGLAVVEHRLTPLLGLLAVALLGAAVLRWPFLGAAALLLLITSALPPKLVLIPVGPIELRGYELVLLLLFGVAVIAPRARTWGGTAGAAIAVFLVLLALSTLAAISAGRVSFSDAFDWGRDFVFLLLFFVVVRLFPDRRALDRLILFAAVVGALTGVMSIALATTHNLPALFQTAGQGFAQEQQGITGDLNRVRLPGTALAYGLLWLTVLRLLRARGAARWGYGLLVAGMVVNLALSFNRNMWVGAFAGLAAVLLLGGVHVRRSFAVGGSVVAVAVAIALLAGVGVSKQSPVAPIIQRGATLINPRAVTQENSLEDRAHETERAWAVIQQHPLQGVGPGAQFGVFYSERQVDGSYRPAPQLFLHDQYLYLILIAGVPGLAAFLCFLLAVLRRGRWLLSDPDGLALTVGVGMIMLSAFVMIAFSTADMLTILTLLSGAIVASSPPAGGARTRA